MDTENLSHTGKLRKQDFIKRKADGYIEAFSEILMQFLMVILKVNDNY